MSGLQGHKQLWLEVQKSRRAIILSPAQHRIIEQGKEVGQYRQQFRSGQLVQERGIEATQATQDAIALEPLVCLKLPLASMANTGCGDRFSIY
ncbi:MAG: hypothetical protein HC780_26405 [Leptolyngbyaceae cyanobacterium CSU_1_3]|nr:hypothetical protein [Leptolyngbyaceae cyanobacterium CSU_1_3]